MYTEQWEKFMMTALQTGRAGEKREAEVTLVLEGFGLPQYLRGHRVTLRVTLEFSKVDTWIREGGPTLAEIRGIDGAPDDKYVRWITLPMTFRKGKQALKLYVRDITVVDHDLGEGIEIVIWYDKELAVIDRKQNAMYFICELPGIFERPIPDGGE